MIKISAVLFPFTHSPLKHYISLLHIPHKTLNIPFTHPPICKEYPFYTNENFAYVVTVLS